MVTTEIASIMDYYKRYGNCENYGYGNYEEGRNYGNLWKLRKLRKLWIFWKLWKSLNYGYYGNYGRVEIMESYGNCANSES